ncbi:MAG: MBL fold metallo-hydrolase, partial [Halobacteriota archaeon]
MQASKIEVPTPFSVGAVNTYVYPEHDLVVDPGPDTETAYGALTEGLHEVVLPPADVDHLVVTHPDIDHFGVAARLHEESGCDVLAHPDALPTVGDFEARYLSERDYFSEYLVEMGMPSDEAEAVVDLPRVFVDLAPAVPEDALVAVEPGPGVGPLDEVEAVETPGHSHGTYCYLDGEVMLSGDHVLAEITPNPVLRPPEDGRRPHSLAEYLDSLERVLDYDVERALPGHGPAVDDVEARVRETVDHHLGRKERLYEMVVERPRTAYELMHDVFEGLPSTEYFYGMSEIIG